MLQNVTCVGGVDTDINKQQAASSKSLLAPKQYDKTQCFEQRPNIKNQCTANLLGPMLRTLNLNYVSFK